MIRRISLMGRLRPFTHHASRITHHAGGFTLLEVLVALAIVGLAVTVVMQLLSANVRSLAVSEDYIWGTMKGEAKIREVLDSGDLSENSWTETTKDGYRMNITVSDVLTERAQTLGARLVQVDLTISWKRGTKERSLTLQTMKLVSAVEAGSKQ